MTDPGILQRTRRSFHAVGDAVSLDGRATPTPVVAAFSGGADSLALLIVLRELERLQLLSLTAVHVDHGVRRGSEQEATLVASVAARLGVDFRGVAIPSEALAAHAGVGHEEAMRRERYRLLASAARDVDAQVVATGHHRRDQAETMLLHLLRGAGLHGAGGMREVSRISVPWWTEADGTTPIVLWRPLLGESPVALHAVLDGVDLPIVDDPTNRSEAFRRNAVRHRVLPLLESVAPGSEANLASYAHRAREDDDALDTMARDALGDVRGFLARERLLGRPVAIQRRMLRQWVAVNAPVVELSFDRTEALRTLVERNEGGKAVEIGAGWRVHLRGGVLSLASPPKPDTSPT